MSSNRRVERLNSLLREVISEVIRKDVRNPLVAELVSVASVEITKDLRQAKVFISVIGSEQERKETLEALQTASGFIAVNASKKVRMRFFPTLTFKLDTTVESQMHIDALIQDIKSERTQRDDG